MIGMELFRMRCVQREKQKERMWIVMLQIEHLTKTYGEKKAVNDLSLHIEHTEASIRTLEAESARLQRLCHEKEYTYMLSKSQNVIQLRTDKIEWSEKGVAESFFKTVCVD